MNDSEEVLKEVERVRQQQEEYRRQLEIQEQIGDKKRFLEANRIEDQYNRLVKNKQAADQYNSKDLLTQTKEELEELEQEQREYFEGLKKRMPFIDENNPYFMDVVAFCPNQLILIAAKSGKGKSTASDNIAYEMTRLGFKPLVISNEETAQDIYARVFAMHNGLNYQRRNELSDEEREKFIKATSIMSKYMTAISSNYKGLEDPTSTIEGLESVLDNIVRYDNHTGIDAVLIDYYQCFQRSLKYPHKKGWEVLVEVTEMLEKYRRIIKIPIVLFAQLKDNDDSFKERIEGGKSIFNRCTIVLEAIAEQKDYKTVWKVHKNRFNSKTIDSSFETGWWQGRYVPYDEKHKQNVVELKNKQYLQREAAEQNRLKKAEGESDANSK